MEFVRGTHPVVSCKLNMRRLYILAILLLVTDHGEILARVWLNRSILCFRLGGVHS